MPDDLLKQISTPENTSNDGDQTNALALRLLTDPDVRALLEAKERGQRVRVVSSDEPAVGPSALEDDFFEREEISPRDLAKYILGNVQKLVKSSNEQVSSSLNEKLGHVIDYVKGQATNTYKSQLQEIQSKYKDFQEYVPDIRELAQQAPGLSIEEMYFISKNRRAQGGEKEKATEENTEEKSEEEEENSEPNVSSERPSTGGAAPPPAQPIKTNREALGDWRDSLDAAVDKSLDGIDFSQIGE